MKKPSKLKKNRKKILSAAVAAVAIAAAFLYTMLNSELKNCDSLVSNFTPKAINRVVVKHSDGGLLVSSQISETRGVFLGYVGPNSVEKLMRHFVESGYTKVTISSDSQCLANNGLTYTLVEGNYNK